MKSPNQRSTSAPKSKRNVSKKTRFEIFKRDSFTCQYCGAQPPTVTLVVDHITPKVADGPCEPINLITACESCNQGKGGRLLGEVHPRPDADLMYLATMQEVAEIERFNEAQKKLREKRALVIENLQDTWFFISDVDWCPANSQMLKMIERGSLENCHETIKITSLAVAEGRCTKATWLRYMWAVFYRLEKGEQNG